MATTRRRTTTKTDGLRRGAAAKAADAIAAAAPASALAKSTMAANVPNPTMTSGTKPRIPENATSSADSSHNRLAAPRHKRRSKQRCAITAENGIKATEYLLAANAPSVQASAMRAITTIR